MKKTNAKPVLTLMCGLPRSGKSTWIEKNKKDDIVVSADEVRRAIFGHQFHQAAEGFVWAFVEGMVQMLLEQGKSVIVDATSTTSSSRISWMIMARKYDVKLRIIWMQTSLEECLRRNEKSTEDKRVPEDIIVRMSDRFSTPDIDETSAYNGKNYCVEVIPIK